MGEKDKKTYLKRTACWKKEEAGRGRCRKIKVLFSFTNSRKWEGRFRLTKKRNLKSIFLAPEHLSLKLLVNALKTRAYWDLVVVPQA